MGGASVRLMTRALLERSIVLLMLLATTPTTAVRSETGLRFDVTDPRDVIIRTMDSSLALRVVRVRHSRVAHFGWEVQVVERSAGASGRSLLRHRSFSGGPHPTDVLAWLSHERYYPDERTLPVLGYPYEVRIRLIDCRTEQVGEDVGFVSGSVVVTWRRLDSAGSPTAGRFSHFAALR